MTLTIGNFLDGQAEHESSNNYAFFKAVTTNPAYDLLGRLSWRRSRFEAASIELWGEIRDWKVPQTQDVAAIYVHERKWRSLRLQFYDETGLQIWQRLACWWKYPNYADNDPATWSDGLRTYIRKAGEAITALGHDGWTEGQGWLV